MQFTINWHLCACSSL